MALRFAVVMMAFSVSAAMAADAQPSVQDNITAMDRDRDGMVTVSEVRAFIEATHGRQYQTAVLDEMESLLHGRSCATPFAGFSY